MEAEMLDFLRHLRIRIATTTYQRKQWQIRSFVKYIIDEKKHFSTLNRADVEKYLQSCGAMQQTRQSLCQVIREFYDFLKIRHTHLYPSDNPAEKIAFKPDTSVKLFKVPSEASMDKIFDRLTDADTELPLRNRLMAELAYGSGLRRMELSRLNVEDIDRESNTVRVTGKGDKTRIVPLTSQAMNTFRQYVTYRQASRGPLFLSFRGRRVRPKTIGYLFHDKIGMRPHLMRHACATHMLKNGCNIRVIQELLGHNRLSTTYVYTAVEKSTLREVIGRNHPRAIMSKYP